MTPALSSRGAETVQGRKAHEEARALGEERDFLLTSLADLEVEHDAGDIDEADYLSLKHDYSVRAADVLRTLAGGGTPTNERDSEPTAGTPANERGREPTAGTPTNERGRGLFAGTAANERGRGPRVTGTPRRWLRSPGRRGLWVGAALIIVGGGIGYAVVASSRPRAPGETISGQNVGPSRVTQLLVAAQKAEVRGDAVGELKDTRAILATDPTQPQALTLEGWLLAQTQQPKVLAQGIGLLSLAVEVDPGLAEAHAYLGIARLSQKDDRDAIPQLEWYLGHHPDPRLAAKFRVALAQARASMATSSSIGGG